MWFCLKIDYAAQNHGLWCCSPYSPVSPLESTLFIRDISWYIFGIPSSNQTLQCKIHCQVTFLARNIHSYIRYFPVALFDSWYIPIFTHTHIRIESKSPSWLDSGWLAETATGCPSSGSWIPTRFHSVGRLTRWAMLSWCRKNMKNQWEWLRIQWRYGNAPYFRSYFVGKFAYIALT